MQPTNAAIPGDQPAANAVELTPLDSPKESCCSNGLSRTDQLALDNHNQLVAAALAQSGQKPNILIIWGDDIGWNNPSAYNRGMMGAKTPNIDRVA
ncbi:MAG: arylsulfatase, partial [Planctomycetaceae bacterium]